MKQEEKVHDIADQLQEVIRKQGVEMYLVPDATHTVLVHGRVDLLPLAEWIIKRIG